MAVALLVGWLCGVRDPMIAMLVAAVKTFDAQPRAGLPLPRTVHNP
jgi:hypothetical protein